MLGNMSGKLELGVESTSPNFAKLTVLLRGIAHTWLKRYEGLPVWYACHQVDNGDVFRQYWSNYKNQIPELMHSAKMKHKTQYYGFQKCSRLPHVEYHWYIKIMFLLQVKKCQCQSWSPCSTSHCFFSEDPSSEASIGVSKNTHVRAQLTLEW